MKKTVVKIAILVLISLLLMQSVALAVVPLNEDETALVKLLNEERKKAGVPELELGPRLIKVARAHSIDMIKNNYFGHVSPTAGSLAARLKKGRVKNWLRAGENLAGASSVKIAFDLLMQSKPHKTNMLKAEYNRLGVGVIKGGPYGFMITMIFIERP